MNSPAKPMTETLFLHEDKAAVVPRVTVVIPLYNYARFITEALETVAAQTISGLDIMVIDDCSADDGGELASDWMRRHAGRFRKATVLRHAVNGGLAATRNTGFGRSETEYIFPLDADNLIYPCCLEKLVGSLAHTRAAFAYCLVRRFLTPLGPVPPPLLMHLHPWHPETLHLGNKIDAMVLHRKFVWQAAGGYSLVMPRQGWEDYDLWFKIARLGGYGLHVPQILAQYRVHGESMLHTVTNEKAAIEVLGVHLRQTYPEFFDRVEIRKSKRR